ncbi:MAG TPA: HAMP domain-containing sensor histidine kinase [Candidatus Dormibacteraeota bacterium]|nr:HAMP domain-containing sensor histidine kinase [Candidatus Dormibacteraeota bacterium]
MGRRLQARARGERQLSLRFRLLAAAAGIVATSLLMSGALTWLLVRNVELQAAQDSVDRSVQTATLLVRHQECFARTGAATNAGLAACRQTDYSDFIDRLNTAVVPTLSGARLLLLGRQRQIVYDSQDPGNFSTINVTASKRVANVAEAQPVFGGQRYLAAAMAIPQARDPLSAAWVVVARPESAVATAAAGELVPRLLLAGGAALLVALVLVLAVSRSVTRPLTQLAGAAEDIAGGNYSRRVGIRGPDEIGHLGAAFDNMAEAVERARRTQREFLANVSHELKTPLTSLIGFSQALTDGSLKTDAERTRAATIVHEESERVLRMSQELLDLARVEAGTVSFHITAVDLAAQLQQELDIVRPRAAAADLALETELPADLPPVAADPERLHQVLDNLLDNAVKYAPPGSKVRISASGNGSGVETIVANATGDHRPDPERMFERFYRADASRSAAAGGVGLGLAISRELVVAMKGTLRAELNGGDTLLLRLSLPKST